MINPTSTILDVVSDFPASEDFFRQYDGIAEKCVLCNNLFDSIDEFCKTYDLDSNQFLKDLNQYIEKTLETI